MNNTKNVQSQMNETAGIFQGIMELSLYILAFACVKWPLLAFGMLVEAGIALAWHIILWRRERSMQD